MAHTKFQLLTRRNHLMATVQSHISLKADRPCPFTFLKNKRVVTAGKVPIEMPGSIMIKDLTHLAVASDAADPDLVNNGIFHATLSCSGRGAKARLWWANRLF